MRKGYKISLVVITILMLITITIGTSYSYYSVSDVQTDSNAVSTACFKVDFADQDSISLSNAYPISEATALTQTPYQFTITNGCTSDNSSKDISFDISLNTLVDPVSTLTSSIRYKLVEVGGTSFDSAMLTSAEAYTLGDTIKSDEGIDASYLLASGTLVAGASKTYQLYLWIDESATLEVANQTFTGKVLVYSYNS